MFYSSLSTATIPSTVLIELLFLLHIETAARFLTEKDEAQKQAVALKKELESAKKESQEAAEKQRQLYEEKLAQVTAREADLGKRLHAASTSLSGKCDAP